MSTAAEVRHEAPCSGVEVRHNQLGRSVLGHVLDAGTSLGRRVAKLVDPHSQLVSGCRCHSAVLGRREAR